MPMKGKSSSIIAFAQNTRDEVRIQGRDGNVCGTISAQPGMKQQTYIVMKKAGKDGSKR